MTPHQPQTHEDRPALLIGLGLAGLLGSLALVAGTLLGPFFVPNYDWVADTISDMAAGEGEIVMDVALYLYAASLIALSLGAAHLHLGQFGWSGGLFILVILALVVTLVGVRNEYGDGDNEGIVIHIYLVYAMGALYAVGPWLMADGAGRISTLYFWIFRIAAIAWAVAAPIFFVLPTTYDGLWERILGLITLGWTIPLAWLLFQQGRARAKSGGLRRPA
ncbi:DUF998 domain-containing protein [Aestuariibius insulae]|uniref:DUF998 domain-containing protein n=1 Tax=Aestuariibius insulae TaxID=2058287 RepID=UPI00345EB211